MTVNDLLVDSHQVVTLCALRPVFVSSGTLKKGDGWVDAKGAFVAGPVCELPGEKGIGSSEFPPVETAQIDGEVALRQHSEDHTMGPNWPTCLEFAERDFETEANNL